MNKIEYESPELEIRWFETEEICGPSTGVIDPGSGDGIVDDDDFGDDGEW